ncbi:MAG: choice-of-anchor N protein [Thermodesulfobacteriota bacterium]
MNLRSITTSIAIALLILGLAGPAQAVPNLQLYSPQGTYSPDDETWYIPLFEYDLWVIGANYYIYDVKLAAAVPDGETGTITISYLNPDGGPNDGMSSVVSYHEDSTPVMGDGGLLPYSGIYPADFYEYYLGDFDKNDYPVEDMVDKYYYGLADCGNAYGEIKQYHVKVDGYTWVHFDTYDHIYLSDKHCKNCFAPFSHACDGAIPEPATMLLVGTGLISLGCVARRKCKK